MDRDIQPELVRQISKDESFEFQCHPGVTCFNECCRLLELALTPYDVMRLKNCLGLSCREFLDKYCLIEQDSDTSLPQIYLGMVDDGRGSCPFVAPQGCSVYHDRPGACRTYPLGRGAFLDQHGHFREVHVLLQEPHCRGFDEAMQQSVSSWNDSQDLAQYNHFNDQVMTILHHPQIKRGMEFTGEQIDSFWLGLYDLENFRAALLAGRIELPFELDDERREKLITDDGELLAVGIQWVRHELFDR